MIHADLPQLDTLYYDGQCGLCIRSTRILRRLDWLHQLRFEDFTELDDAQLPVARETALQGIPMRTRSGRILIGHDAMRRALVQTPLGCLPALVMYVPGLSHISAAVYRAIASRRSRSLRCAPDSASS